MLPGANRGQAAAGFRRARGPAGPGGQCPGAILSLLKASQLGSISLGSPIFFRDLDVGTVLGWDIGDMAESVTIHAFVRAPYDSYVHDETRFWNASGFRLKLAGTGVDVQLESLRALLLGGIAFDTPTRRPTSRSRARKPRLPTVRRPGGGGRRLLHPQDPGGLLLPGFGQRAGTGLRGHHARPRGRPCHRCAPCLRPGQERRCGAGPFRGSARTHRRRRGRVFKTRRRGGRCDAQAGTAGDAAKRQPDHRATAGDARLRSECAAGAADDGGQEFRAAHTPKAAGSPGSRPPPAICSTR